MIVRDGQILTAKRREGGPTGLLWEFPGGKIELGETPQEALRRELAEELGVSVVVGAQIGVFVSELADLRLHLDCYWCSLPSGEPHAHDHAEIQWWYPEKLPALDWAAPDVPAVRVVLEQIATQQG